MPNPPIIINNINDLIEYINDNIFQNNSQLITGQVGLNAWYNLATLLKQNPENFQKASVITDANINYVTESDECIIIFTNNSQGEIDYVTNPNIWNKYYIVNQTDNIRNISGGQYYLDINGNQQTSIAARTTIVIAKGDDDFWYQINGAGGGSVKPPLIGTVDGGSADDPVSGTSVFQSNKLIGLAQSNSQKCQIFVDAGCLVNYGNNISFILDNVTGEIDISPNTWQVGSSLYIDLNQ